MSLQFALTLARLRSLPWLNVTLVAAILAAAALLLARSGGGPGVLVEVRDPLPGIDEIRVAVTGAVERPGVVTVRPGDRVIDAITRAGGLRDDADATAINLSRRLVDEDHIVVPVHGAASPLLDVNTATAEELDALPGIGPVYSSRIVEARTAEGAFATTDELVKRGVLPAHVYEGIRDLIAAR